MRVFPVQIPKAAIVRWLKQSAMHGFYTGTTSTRAYVESCKAYAEGPDQIGSLLILTRDIGMHTGGWFKNPDYERCWHLSLSFVAILTGERLPKQRRLTDEWLNLVFGDSCRLLWCEPPYSPHGKKGNVWHYRLFCDAAWQPIKPRKEPYTREFTEIGWKSFSELHGHPPAFESQSQLGQIDE